MRTTPPDTEVEIRAAGQRLAVNSDETSGGRRYRVPVPEPADLLTVSILLPNGNRGPGWSLRLAGPEKPAWLDEVNDLAGRGRTVEARKLLTQLRSTVSDREQGLVFRTLALLARGDGNLEEEERYLRQQWSSDRAVNRWSGEAEAATRLAGLYIEQGRFSEARQAFAALQPLPDAPADKQILIAYHQGLLADAVGDYRLALEQLRKAEELATRLGNDKLRWDSRQILARILQDLGRSQEASKLFESLRADPHPTNPCGLGILLTNWGWSRLLARDAGEEVEDPTPILEQARAEFDKNPCTPGERLDARLNLSLAHQQEGRWDEARKELDQARALRATPSLAVRLWWDDLEARAAIAAGQPEHALDLYEKLAEKAELARSPDGRLRASLGLAKVRIALGLRAAALDALAEADRRLDEQSWYIPVHEGRETFLAQREEATRLYLELLLDNGQRQRALDLTRRARSRLLRQFAVRDRLAQLTPDEQRKWIGLLTTYRSLRDAMDRQAAQEWRVAANEVERAREAEAAQLARTRDALDRALASLGNSWEGSTLSPPGPGEVLLAYHPLPGGRWAGFAATAQSIEVSNFKLSDETLTSPADLSRILLGPFQSVIAASERLRVLPFGALRSVDFHALPFAGEPLLARHLVVYSLDLPARPSSAPATARSMALVVSDPQGNLPAAREEAALVTAAVRAWGPGWSFERLAGPKARAETVLAALPSSGLFHYAGHGIFAGFAGWDSELPLADESRLALGDVLALHPAPVWVVLSSCNAGRSSEEAPGEGIGLANAFLLAGSQAVVAATRPVDDRSARDLMRELYRGWQPGLDLPRQLQRAQLTCLRKDPSSDATWTSFRLLVP